METHLLEINLISAQGLKPPSANLRRMQTYALAWVDSSTKLRTRIDRIGGENPTWNDKFIFRVSADFLSNDTSAVSVEIYAVGYLKDPLIGTVRFLISNCLSAAFSFTSGIGTPSFTALQIRRPSGRFHGVLNLGVMVINGSDFAALTEISAIGYRDLMGENRRRHRDRRGRPPKREQYPGGDSCEHSCGDSGEYSDDATSSTSSSSATSTTLKDWNGMREMAGKKDVKLDGGGLLCGLGFQRKIHLSPSDQNFQILTTSDEKKS
ncbi:hypothetical protein HHK36_029082 [Tetracentron sinense]|uniref:C2 domain-containing protein n=1 Tax=Tetracentron sinense TaxID=13715 RepID=A0A834YE94_TETSI|nr:hypothetical protein HHK36_029082 [Tetracentron sinense]